MKIYKGHNHPFLQRLQWDEPFSQAEMAVITKVELKFCDQYIDSENHPDCFDLTSYIQTSEIGIDIGLIDFPVAEDKAELIVYDSSHPAGRVIIQIDITISDEAIGGSPLADPLKSKIKLNDLNDVSTEGGETGYSLAQLADGTFAFQVAAGGGDMLKSVYDSNNSGIVDKTEGVKVVTDLPVSVGEGGVVILNSELYIDV